MGDSPSTRQPAFTVGIALSIKLYTVATLSEVCEGGYFDYYYPAFRSVLAFLLGQSRKSRQGAKLLTPVTSGSGKSQQQLRPFLVL